MNIYYLFYGRFGNIIRAKGQVMAGNHYFQFDMADSHYSITELDSKSMGKMVFIRDGSRKKVICENFGKYAKYKKIKYKTINRMRTALKRVVLFLLK